MAEEAVADLVGQVLVGDPADQQLGEDPAGHLVHPRPDVGSQRRADQGVGDLALEQPGPGLGELDHVGEQVVQLEHLDPVLGHLGHEVDVVTPRLVDPDHVVEEQLVAVVGGEPLVGEPG